MVNGIIELLGKRQSEPDVVDLIKTLSLSEISDAPPSRQYVGAKARGIDLIFEDGRVFSIQIYVRPGQGFDSFSGQLPLGIQSDMNKQQLVDLLGSPAKQDDVYSSFLVSDKKVKVSIDFDDSARLKLISFARIKS